MANRKKFTFALVATINLIVLLVLITNKDRLLASCEFWRNFESMGVNPQGLFEYRHRRTGILFIWIPGGTFLMGSPEGEVGRSGSEGPQHQVTLSPFLIGKYEVSQGEWEGVMGTNPSHFKGGSLPVENVSWKDVQEYSQKVGLSLPSEAQWEYACRAGTMTPFSHGETISVSQVNYDGGRPYADAPRGEHRRRTVFVDSFEPNQLGLHQMHGNVMEWCKDSWDPEFFSNLDALEKDPVCESYPYIRVIRGGCWNFSAEAARSARRGGYIPDYTIGALIGLRLAYNLPDALR